MATQKLGDRVGPTKEFPVSGKTRVVRVIQCRVGMEDWPASLLGFGNANRRAATARWENPQAQTQVPILPYLAAGAMMFWCVPKPSLADMLRFSSFLFNSIYQSSRKW